MKQNLIFLIILLFLLSLISHCIGPNYNRQDVTVKDYKKVFPKPVFKPKYPVWIIAHRGYSGIAPENTISAFKAAIEAGADMIELDVHFSKDKELMVIHDYTLDRTTDGKGKIDSYTLAELKKLDAGYKAKFKDKYKGEKIPTLDEVLELAKGKVMIDIEIKKDTVVPEKIGGDYVKDGLEEKVIQCVKKHKVEDNVLICSFSHISIKRCKKLAPNICGALLWWGNILFVQPVGEGDIGMHPAVLAAKFNADAINPNMTMLSKEYIEDAHKYGIKIFPYTIDNENDIKKAIEMGADGIITNFPDRVIKVCKEMGLQRDI